MTPVGVQNIYRLAKERIYAEISRQGGTPETVLAIRHLEKIDHILDAETVEEAARLAYKAEDAVFLTCLHLRTKGDITPKTPEIYHSKADDAESKAKELYDQYFESKATTKEETEERDKLLLRSQKQEVRAKRLREYADALVLNPLLPAFVEDRYKLPTEKGSVDDHPSKRQKRGEDDSSRKTEGGKGRTGKRAAAVQNRPSQQHVLQAHRRGAPGHRKRT